jgi:hypothetical protein
MALSRRSSAVVAALCLLGLATSLVWAVVTVRPAAAQELLAQPSPSDPRATFVDGNVGLCAAAGFPLTTQVGAQGSASAGDANVSGTVATNAGTVHPGEGQEVNVTITGPDVVIDAVIVKGGAAHNIYSDPAVLPPTLAAPQHYISPFNGGGDIPAISHWFICYHLETPPPTGTLIVQKGVIPPDGIPAAPLPVGFSAIVNCNDGIHTDIAVTFGLGGGRGLPSATLDGIPAGSVCTIVEQDTGSFPAGTVITYDPVGADTTGVTIGASSGVIVSIVNDFSATAVVMAPVTVTKAVIPAPGVVVPSTFAAVLECGDGTTAEITLPGTGGTGTPSPVLVRTLSICAIAEIPASLPAGWTVSYSLDGAAPTATPPVFDVVDGTAITITITNDATSASTTTTTTTAPAGGGAVGGPARGAAGQTLPRSGPVGLGLLFAVGLASIAVGWALMAEGRRRSPQHGLERTDGARDLGDERG